ncbi:MAG: nitronate monooxygenase [Proteobacteria bacterium]|nr:nitronate monooxygenase [Pseudomonadota bacterium]
MWKIIDLTKKLGINLPIIQAPMAGGATTPQLVSAVSNSGGLGSLGAGYMAPNEIRQAIKKIRELTNKPFAVNLFIPEDHQASSIQIQNACDDINQACGELDIEIFPVKRPYTPVFAEQLHVVLEEKVPVFSYTFGLLNVEWVSQLKKNHTVLIGTATSLTEAYALQENGADIIIAQGSEAGGHRGTFLDKAENSLIGLMSLVPQLIDAIKIPIVAAGGIMDGRGIVAALQLGSCGVQMGTAFLTCHESGTPLIYKKILLIQKQDNTILTRSFSGKLARGIRNQFTDNLNQSNILDYPIQNALTSVMRKAAIIKNNTNFMSLWSGQSAQLCRDMSASELMNELTVEVEALLN